MKWFIALLLLDFVTVAWIVHELRIAPLLVDTNGMTTLDRMITHLALLRQQITNMTARIRSDASLPPEDQALMLTHEVNNVRSAIVALDTALHARHNERHPMTPIETETTPAQPLDAETRADIDATP